MNVKNRSHMLMSSYMDTQNVRCLMTMAVLCTYRNCIDMQIQDNAWISLIHPDTCNTFPKGYRHPISEMSVFNRIWGITSRYQDKLPITEPPPSADMYNTTCRIWTKIGTWFSILTKSGKWRGCLRHQEQMLLLRSIQLAWEIIDPCKICW